MICFFFISIPLLARGQLTSALSLNPGLSFPIHLPWELRLSPTHLCPAGRAMRSGADVLGLQQTAAKRTNAGAGPRPKATA